MSLFWTFVFTTTALAIGVFLGLYIRIRRLPKHNVEPQSHQHSVESGLPSVSRSANPDYAASLLALRDPGHTGSISAIVSAASMRGTAHVESGVPRQDNYCVLTKHGEVVVALSDGVSSAVEAHLGSLFLIQNFERYYDETFPQGHTAEVGKWRDLSLKLSQNLVAMHISKSKLRGLSIPDDVVKLRTEAASYFASTLEVLVFENASAGEPISFTYVRLSGDGGGFVVTDQLEKVFDDGADPALKNSEVSPLPITDTSPFITQGSIGPGQSLVVCTDGVGDFIQANSAWSEQLVSYCRRTYPTKQELLDLISFPDANSRDDRTLVAVRNI
jgi:serine/threonine protein phosphatase PrpC